MNKMKIFGAKIPTYILIVLVLAGILVGLTLAQTVATNNYKVPQSGTINSTFGLAITINGNVWTNGTAINWGTLTPGTPITLPITFQNTGTVKINTIVLTSDPSTPLPAGWTETIPTLPNAGLGPGQMTTSGSITLTPSASAVAGTYNWNSYINTT